MTAVAARNSQAVEASRRPGSSRLGSEPGRPVAPIGQLRARHGHLAAQPVARLGEGRFHFDDDLWRSGVRNRHFGDDLCA